jgi:hypothetical protein
VFIYVREKAPATLPPAAAKLYVPRGPVPARLSAPRLCTRSLGLTMPAVLDPDGRVDRAYVASPDRLYVVDERGRIAYQGQRGPMHVNPSDLADWLAENI